MSGTLFLTLPEGSPVPSGEHCDGLCERRGRASCRLSSGPCVLLWELTAPQPVCPRRVHRDAAATHPPARVASHPAFLDRSPRSTSPLSVAAPPLRWVLGVVLGHRARKNIRPVGITVNNSSRAVPPSTHSWLRSDGLASLHVLVQGTRSARHLKKSVKVVRAPSLQHHKGSLWNHK